jgi:hypothetical protein
LGERSKSTLLTISAQKHKQSITRTVCSRIDCSCLGGWLSLLRAARDSWGRAQLCCDG